MRIRRPTKARRASTAAARSDTRAAGGACRARASSHARNTRSARKRPASSSTASPAAAAGRRCAISATAAASPARTPMRRERSRAMRRAPLCRTLREALASPASAIYYRSAHWRQLRWACFERDGGLCVVPGCRRRARVADHIVTRPDVPCPTELDVLSNLRSLCASHDAQVKELGGKRKQGGEFAVRGCDESGWPLDPSHPWNRSQQNH